MRRNSSASIVGALIGSLILLTPAPVRAQAFMLTWSPASDNVTPVPSLQYEVRASPAPNLDTIARFNANGAVVAPYASDVREFFPPVAVGTTYYNVAVRDAAGNVAVYKTTTVIYTPPSIRAQPLGVTVRQGSPATFTVTATGSPAPKYQWRRGGVAIAGATGASYTLPSAGRKDNNATFTVQVYSLVGSVISNTVTLHVTK